MMKTPALLFATLSLVCVFSATAQAQEQAQTQPACVSDNPVIGAMQTQWNTTRTVLESSFTDGFVPITLTLLPLAESAARYGALTIKSKKPMRYTNRYSWHIATEGDYWLAADSAAWMDVIDLSAPSNAPQALEPLTFNHGLRCAGIHKALKFHLHAGNYSLLIASDEAEKVKVSAGRETPAE